MARGMFGMMFLKVGSESLLLMDPFWWTQKEWEKRQKVDKNLELGGFLGGRSDFLLMFFVDIFTTDVAEPFFLLDENSPKKKLTSETRGDTRNSGSELHHWSFTKNIDRCFRK